MDTADANLKLDTGTTYILGPTTDVKNFWGTVGGARHISGSWQVRCDRGVAVGFRLGDDVNSRTFYIDAADISQTDAWHQDGWCMGGVQANDKVSYIALSRQAHAKRHPP
jgi:hypothetical protein